MFDDSFLRAVREELLKIDGDFREAFLKRSSGFVVSREKDLETAENADDCGIGIRVRRGGDWSFWHLTSGEADRLVSFVKDIAAGRKTERPGDVKICGGAEEGPVGCGEAGEMLARAAEGMKENGALSFIGILKAGSDERAVVTGEGKILSEERRRTTYYAQSAMLEPGKAAKGAECAMETRALSGAELEKMIKSVSEESLRLCRVHLEAKVSPEGKMDVVLAGMAAGMLIHETVGHLFEADNRRMAGAIRPPGETMAPPFFSLVERGPSADIASFDDEGNSPSMRTLIESGRAAGLLADARTSAELGIPVTGNGRRENHRFEPLPRAWKLDCPAGDGTDADLCSDVTIGLYIKRLSDGKMDLVKMEAVFPVAEGYLIREGKISDPVTNACINVAAPAFLKEIVAVGSEKKETRGLCVKRSQAVWTGESIPSLKLSKVAVRRADKQS